MNLAARIREKRKALGLTQAQVGAYFEITSVSVSEWERGVSRPEQTRLDALARLLKTSISYLLTGKESAYVTHLVATDPSKDHLDNLIAVTAEQHREFHAGLKTKSSIRALHPDDPQPDDVVYVPESRIEFAAGAGRAPQYELIEDREPATYRLSWFQREHINPERVRRFRVSGDSMEPFLYDRDTILVNEDETNIVDGKLYAIRYGDDLRVKYLFRRLDGTLILRSVNPAYKDEEVSPQLAQEHIGVIGRVRDKSGKGGL